MELLCVKSHSQGIVTVGNFYPLYRTKKQSCCGLEIVDIGIRTNAPTMRCRCGARYTKPDKTAWLGAALFASCEESELTELIEVIELKS